MSGILNNKQRVMDTIITTQGRAALAAGQFQIAYVVFTDGATFYQGDVVSGSADATNRIFLEASNAPQDQVTYTTDDLGRVNQFGGNGANTQAGQIFSGSGASLTFFTGSAFQNMAQALIGASTDNFKNLYSLGSIDPIYEYTEFLLSDNTINFKLTDTLPIANQSAQSVNITHAESFFADSKFANLPNFQYLPPLTKLPANMSPPTSVASDQAIQKQYGLGDYQALGPTNKFDIQGLLNDVNVAMTQGSAVTINFDPSNNDNSLHAQFFEVKTSELYKLDVLEVGRFPSSVVGSPDMRVFYAGKVYVDDYGTSTFIKLFTLIYE